MGIILSQKKPPLNGVSSPLTIADTDAICYHYLNILYHDVHVCDFSKQISGTYGEILYASIDKLLETISCSSQDVFVDYGSGLGKILIQTFLKTPVKEAYGIELSPELHAYALKAAQKLQLDAPELYTHRHLEFYEADFLKFHIPHATIALVNATCYTQALLNGLGRILEDTPSLHTVLSTRPIHPLKRLVFKKSFSIECSWDSTLCYLYTNS